MKIKYYRELDGIRGLAILMVMLFHFFQNFDGGLFFSYAMKISKIGQTGVTLFFVLSGFLITRILLATKDLPGYFSKSYVRRTLRIFPLYYFFLFLTYFIVPFLFKIPSTPIAEQIYWWVYLQNFAMTFNWPSNGPNHFWSLGVEEHFYLFWPFVIYFFSKKGIVMSVVFIFLISIIAKLFLLGNGYGIFYFTLSRIDEIAIGALLAILEINGKINAINRKRFFLFFLIFAVGMAIIWGFFSGSGNIYLPYIKFLLPCLTYTCLIGLVISQEENSRLNNILKFGPLLYTGKISYGLYVYHPLCFFLYERYFRSYSSVLDFITCFAISFIISSLSFFFLEMKFLSFKSFFDYNKKKKLT